MIPPGVLAPMLKFPQNIQSMAPKRGKQHLFLFCILDLRGRFTIDSDGKILELKPHYVAVHPSNYI